MAAYQELRVLKPGARFRFYYEVAEADENDDVTVYELVAVGVGRAAYRKAAGYETVKHVHIERVTGETRDFDITVSGLQHCALGVQVVEVP